MEMRRLPVLFEENRKSEIEILAGILIFSIFPEKVIAKVNRKAENARMLVI